MLAPFPPIGRFLTQHIWRDKLYGVGVIHGLGFESGAAPDEGSLFSCRVTGRRVKKEPADAHR